MPGAIQYSPAPLPAALTMPPSLNGNAFTSSGPKQAAEQHQRTDPLRADSHPDTDHSIVSTGEVYRIGRRIGTAGLAHIQVGA